MTDRTPDPTDPKSRRAKARREPATIDLKATEIRDEAPVPPVGDDTVPPWTDTIPVPGADSPPAGESASDAAAAAPAGPEPADEKRKPRARTWATAPAAPDPAPAEPITSSDAPHPSEPSAAASAAPLAGPLADLESGRASASADRDPVEREAGPGAAQPAVAPPAPAERRRTGFLPLLAAALLGGLVGGAATIAYRAAQEAEPAAADPRLAQLSQQVAAAAPRDALNAIERRLAAIEAQGTAFDERLRTVQAQAERNANQAQQALDRPIPAPQPPPNPAESAAFKDLAARLGALEGAVQGRQDAAAQANAALERRVADQDQRLAALAQQITEQGSDARQASLRAVLADRVQDAVRTGAPYADALSTLRRLNADAAQLAALEPFAASGAPAAATLARDWKAAADRIAAQAQAAQAAQPPQSAADTFWNLAGRVVQISPANGAASGSGELAAVTTALEAGRLNDAAAAWDALPDAARQASQDFGQRLKQRVAAANAAQTLSADAVKRLEAAVR